MPSPVNPTNQAHSPTFSGNHNPDFQLAPPGPKESSRIAFIISFFITMPYYFVMVNMASLQGIIDAYFGKTYTTWHTIREEA